MFVTISLIFFFFFFNDTATTEIYTLSLHDALPISNRGGYVPGFCSTARQHRENSHGYPQDRKSTRLNSSHSQISYAVFCLKKKKKKKKKKINKKKKIKKFIKTLRIDRNSQYLHISK